MPLLKTILHYAGFGKKDKMSNPDEFQPTDIFHHRYQDPQVLIEYVKTLPDIKKDQIKVKSLKDGRLGLSLSRKLEKEEINGALQAFLQAERKRQEDDGE